MTGGPPPPRHCGWSYGTAAQHTLVGQTGREELMGTEDLAVLVSGPIVLAGLWGYAEPRECMRFCRAQQEEEEGRQDSC